MAANLPNIGQDLFNASRLEAIAVLSAGPIVAELVTYIQTGKLEFPSLPAPIAEALVKAIGEAESTIGGPIFDALLGAGLGMEGLGAPGTQEQAAVATIKRALGFGVGLPLAAGALELPLKALLGPHLGATLFESLAHISEEAGIGFFLGTVLANIFETAVGQPLAEAIARRSHPARFDFRIVKLLLKSHKLTEPEALDQLDALGFRPADAQQLLSLADVGPSLGDLQQAYVAGIRTEKQVRDALEQMGHAPEDIDMLVELYLKRSETAGGDLLRTTAQRGFLEHHLSESQYRAILARVHVPAASIALEIEAAKMQLGWGRLSLSIAQLKQLRLDGHLDDYGAIQRLMQLGYDEPDAELIVGEWVATQKVGRGVPSESRILGYLLGGVISREQAVALLVQTGLKVENAAFLADHPGSLGGVFAIQLSTGTIKTALADGIITVDDAQALLDQLSIDPTEASLLIAIAVHAQGRGRKPKQPQRQLTEAQVMAALNLGLVTPSWALAELSTLGYSDADASLLVALEVTRVSKHLPPGWSVLA